MISHVTTTPLSTCCFQILASNSLFNLPQTPVTRAFEEQEQAYQMLGELQPDRISKALYYLSYAAQSAMRLAAALFITIVVAPIGIGFHLTFLSIRAIQAAKAAIEKGRENQEYQEKIKQFQGHLHGLSIDMLATISGMLGLSLYFNPIALDFTFRPVTTTTALLSTEKGFQYLVSSTLREVFGAQLAPEKVLYQDRKSLHRSLSNSRRQLAHCWKTTELKSAINTITSELPSSFEGFSPLSKVGDRSDQEVIETHQYIDRVLQVLEREERDLSRVQICVRAACNKENGINSFLEEIAGYSQEKEGKTLQTVRSRFEEIRAKHRNAQAKLQLAEQLHQEAGRRTLLYYGLSTLPFTIVMV